MENEDLVYRLRKRAEIRRNAKGRKSVELGEPDRISDLLEEAAYRIECLVEMNDELFGANNSLLNENDYLRNKYT